MLRSSIHPPVCHLAACVRVRVLLSAAQARDFDPNSLRKMLPSAVQALRESLARNHRQGRGGHLTHMP